MGQGKASSRGTHRFLCDKRASYERIATHTKLPLIVFYESRLEIKRSLGVSRLDRAARNPINFDKVAEPAEYYPYGPDDDDFIIAHYVLQALARILRKGDTIDNMSNDEMVDIIFEFNHKLHKFLSNETSNKIKKK